MHGSAWLTALMYSFTHIVPANMLASDQMVSDTKLPMCVIIKAVDVGTCLPAQNSTTLWTIPFTGSIAAFNLATEACTCCRGIQHYIWLQQQDIRKPSECCYPFMLMLIAWTHQ